MFPKASSAPDEERCQAVVDFPPLKEKLHIQQFLGCANWLRGYLPAEYGHAAKVIGQWQKPGAAFPEGSPPRHQEDDAAAHLLGGVR